MEIKQSNLFKQGYKKLHKNQLTLVNENIKLIMDNPEIGTPKIGDLTDVRVHKFKYHDHVFLIAYDYDEMIHLLYLMAIGEHQNFYEKLKKHLK